MTEMTDDETVLCKETYYVVAMKTEKGKVLFMNTGQGASQRYYTDKVKEAALFTSEVSARAYLREWDRVYEIEISTTCLRQC